MNMRAGTVAAAAIASIAALGIAAAMLFGQWACMTAVYLVSFYVVGRQKRISRGELWLYIWGTNSPWLLFPLLGLYVSVRLVLDGD